MTKIGVGVPTYNRSAYLRETLLCLKAQENADFSVVVMDNASTDNTATVFQEIVGADKRFSYNRQAINRSALENFNACLEALDTPYFLWRADDDLSDNNYLAALAESLNLDDKADLAVPNLIRVVDGRKSEFFLPEPIVGSPVDRAMLLLRNCRPTWVYGMWRREALVQNTVRVKSRYTYAWASDHALMLPTILAGRVALNPDTRFIQRILGDGSYRLQPMDQLKARRQFAAYAQHIIADLDIPTAQVTDFRAALEFHLNDRVGPLWRLRRRALKQWLRRLLALPQKA